MADQAASNLSETDEIYLADNKAVPQQNADSSNLQKINSAIRRGIKKAIPQKSTPIRVPNVGEIRGSLMIPTRL
ncbi:MAG: hypothetical protein AB7F43_11715 [Bacteriovoracia bacterium]